MGDTRVLQNGTDVRVLQNGTDVRITEGVINYTLTADSVSVTTTGTAATLREAKRLTAASPSATTTGTAATLRYGHNLVATIRTYNTTGLLSSLGQSTVLFGAAGNFQETGTAAALRASRRLPTAYPLTPAAGFVGEAVSNEEIQLDWRTPAGVNLDGYAEMVRGRYLTASSTSVVITGPNARIFKTPPVMPASLILAVPGNLAGDPSSTSIQLTWTPGPSVEALGTSATFSRTRVFASAQGSIVTTGASSTLSYSPRVHYTITASSGAFSSTGLSVGLTEQERINPASGTISTTGLSANLVYSRRLSFSAQIGTVDVTALDAGLVYTEAGQYVITAEAGDLTSTGTSAALRAGRGLDGQSGGVNIDGLSAGIGRRLTMSVAAGALDSSGSSATFSRTKGLSASLGLFNITGMAASLLGIADVYTLVPPLVLYLESGETELEMLSGATFTYLESGETTLEI